MIYVNADYHWATMIFVVFMLVVVGHLSKKQINEYFLLTLVTLI